MKHSDLVCISLIHIALTMHARKINYNLWKLSDGLVNIDKMLALNNEASNEFQTGWPDEIVKLLNYITHRPRCIYKSHGLWDFRIFGLPLAFRFLSGNKNLFLGWYTSWIGIRRYRPLPGVLQVGSELFIEYWYLFNLKRVYNPVLENFSFIDSLTDGGLRSLASNWHTLHITECR